MLTLPALSHTLLFGNVMGSMSPFCQCVCILSGVHLGHTSLLLPRLPKLPSQCYSNGPGHLANLGSSKKIQPEFSQYVGKMTCSKT